MNNRIAQYFNTPVTEAEVLEILLELEEMGIVRRETIIVDGVSEERWFACE